VTIIEVGDVVQRHIRSTEIPLEKGKKTCKAQKLKGAFHRESDTRQSPQEAAQQECNSSREEKSTKPVFEKQRSQPDPG
jgi:hypothetical protein